MRRFLQIIGFIEQSHAHGAGEALFNQLLPPPWKTVARRYKPPSHNMTNVDGTLLALVITWTSIAFALVVRHIIHLLHYYNLRRLRQQRTQRLPPIRHPKRPDNTNRNRKHK